MQKKKIDFNYHELRRVNFTFSHMGEDQVISWMFRTRKEPGIYLDIGAHDHSRLSNTLLLYKKGWRGVSIDMDKKKMKSLKSFRPDDENVVAAISATPGKYIMYYYEYNEMDCMRPVGDPVPTNDGCTPIDQEEIESKTLNEVLKNTRFHNKKIQYLNIDIEGMDLEILKTLDLSIYDPELITVEFHDDETYQEFLDYLTPYGYEKFCFCNYTAFFTKKKS